MSSILPCNLSSEERIRQFAKLLAVGAIRFATSLEKDKIEHDKIDEYEDNDLQEAKTSSADQTD